MFITKEEFNWSPYPNKKMKRGFFICKNDPQYHLDKYGTWSSMILHKKFSFTLIRLRLNLYCARQYCVSGFYLQPCMNEYNYKWRQWNFLIFNYCCANTLLVQVWILNTLLARRTWWLKRKKKRWVVLLLPGTDTINNWTLSMRISSDSMMNTKSVVDSIFTLQQFGRTEIGR